MTKVRRELDLSLTVLVSPTAVGAASSPPEVAAPRAPPIRRWATDGSEPSWRPAAAVPVAVLHGAPAPASGPAPWISVPPPLLPASGACTHAGLPPIHNLRRREHGDGSRPGLVFRGSRVRRAAGKHAARGGLPATSASQPASGSAVLCHALMLVFLWPSCSCDIHLL